MEFKYKKGDKLRCIESHSYYHVGDEVNVVSQDIGSWNEPVYTMSNGIQEHQVYERNFWTLVNSKSLQKTMEKKIYKVLAVNKKTSAVEKDEVVVAVNEQSAILKAFGVDAENVFIKTTEEGAYTEDKPVTAVIVKENKTPK